MRYELTIPANTPQGSPVSQTFYFTASATGLISAWTVRIPRGHAYLTGLQVQVGRGGVVIPGRTSGVEWIRGDGEEVRGGDTIQLDPPQYAIQLRGYNEDDTYPHTFYLDLD